MAREKDRDREKERENRKKSRNRKKRKYGQAKLKHAKRGVYSCGISAVVCFLLLTTLAIAYFSGGNAAPFIGGIGIIAFLLSCVGSYMAAKGFKEREKNYLTCKIGGTASVLFVVGFIMIFCRGLM